MGQLATASFAEDLLGPADRRQQTRRRLVDKPGDQMPRPVAALDLSDPIRCCYRLTVRRCRDIAVPQGIAYRAVLVLELGQLVGQAAQLGLQDSKRVMRHQASQPTRGPKRF